MRQQHNHWWLQWFRRCGQQPWLSQLLEIVGKPIAPISPDSKFNRTTMDLREITEVMEYAISGISKLDTQGRYLYVNKAYADMIGYEPEAMIGMDWQQTVHPGDLERVRIAYQQMVQDGKVEVEAAGIRQDGSKFYKQLVMISAYNKQQQFIGHYCFAKDISDRKQAELALENSQARFAGILEIASDAIISTNANQEIILFNRGAEHIFGYRAEEVLGQPLALLMPDRFTQTHHHHVSQYAQSEDNARQMAERGAIFGRRKDGTEFPAEASISKLTLNGELTFTAFLRDVSDSKHKELVLHQAMEAAEAANLAKSMFLANMSHELRTPLNVILGFAQVMARDPSLTANQLEDLATIRRSGDHLLNLINDILNLSKIEAGYSALEATGFDLISLLHTLRAMMTERAQAKQLQLMFDIAPDVPQFIISDEQKLRQILLNLLSNAIKFTERGQVKLTASVVDSHSLNDKEQIVLCFEITDTGVGIAPKEQSIIFDTFTQAAAGKESVSGTGLGLTISRKLLELMQGTLAVQSELGVGSTFICTVPVHPTNIAGVQPDQFDRTIIGLVPGQAHHRVLVVDDQPENRRLVVRLMTLLGLEVREATNGQEAVQMWQDWQPDLIWMDIRMPGLNGYEATLQIRAMEQEQTSIIIALTAQASQSDRSLALAAGCNDYISKPFREATVLLKLQEHLGLEYLYTESNAPESTQPFLSTDESFVTAPPPLAALPDLAQLPEVWLKELEEAATLGNDRTIAALVAQLPPELAPFTAHIVDLANQFQFEQILNLIQNNFPP